MRSPLAQRPPTTPRLNIITCEDPPVAPKSTPTVRRWKQAPEKEALLLSPVRAETKVERLLLARDGIATGSFRMNCVETPFLVNEDGLNMITRLQRKNEALGDDKDALEAQVRVDSPPPAPTVVFDCLPLLARPVTPIQRSASESSLYTRTHSLGISRPLKLGSLSKLEGRTIQRSLSKSSSVPFIPGMEMGPTESIKTRGSALRTVQASGNTLSKKLLGTIDRFRDHGGPLTASPAHRRNLATFDENRILAIRKSPTPPRARDRHSRAKSLDMGTGKSNDASPPTSMTARADLHVLGNASFPKQEAEPRGFSLGGNLSSSGSISKSLSQLSASASSLRKKVLRPLNKYFEASP